MDFSTIVLAIYALTISNESLIRLRAFYTKTFRSYWLRKVISLFPIILAFSIFIYVTIICKGVCSNESFMPIFAFYSVPIYLIILFSQDSNKGGFKKLKSGVLFLYLIPLVFFLNGISPYLGLKTEGAISMYSNLHVEGRKTNHFLHGVIPGFWNYSDEVITIIESNNKELELGKAFVRYDFDRLLSNLQNVEVTVQSNLKNTSQKISTKEGNWTNTYSDTNWLIRKFLIFKPIDNVRPKICTH